MSSIKTLQDALDHADISSSCVSTSANAMRILAETVRELQQEVKDLTQYAEDNYDKGFESGYGCGVDVGYADNY